MKKIFYMLAAVAMVLASCTTKGYKITGTIDDSVNGDTVYLMARTNRQFVPVDTAVIKNGQFKFTGVQDSAVNRYIVYTGEDDMQPTYLDFFLENGNIMVRMTKKAEGNSITGTPMNDGYQAFKDKMDVVFEKQKKLTDEISAASDEERPAKMAQMKAMDQEIMATVKDGISQNLDSPLGLYLINAYSYYMDYGDLGDLLSGLPAKFQDDPSVVRLKEIVEVASKTAVGQKFVDLDMQDTKGNPVKLSDYLGKGKLTAVDFWAAWCVPCRREMPKLVEAYAKYKNKNFEIVGVSLDRDMKQWNEGIEFLKITWPQMSDLKYWDSEAVKVYAIRSIPHLILVDGEGTIIARGLSGDELLDKLAELLK